MTSDEFASLAQRLGPHVVARPILETVRLQVGGKPFATVGWPEAGWAVIKVDPRRQAWALSLSEALAPEPGRRRKGGVILARLARLDAGAASELLADALTFARPGAARGAVAGETPALRSAVAA